MGPTHDFCEQLHQEKYRQTGESFKECMNRIASALSDNPSHFYAFRNTLLDMRFLPGGRVQAAAGAPRSSTLYNCFVIAEIADSFVKGDGNIMQRAVEAATTLRMGGGVGYDFSTLRPNGAMIRSLGSRSTGPVAFMSVFNSLGDCTAAVGNRRGAQMAVLRIDHPDVPEFIRCKQNAHSLTRFNISLAVTEEFMEALDTGKPFPLRFNGTTYSEVDPAELWESVMRSTWDWAEPGVLFIDRINQMNNLWYCEKIAATNPCGEQPLGPNGACLLGSFNLTKYLNRTIENVFDFDYQQLMEDIRHVVRAMDNVIDVSLYPLEAQRVEATNKRRMGLGVCGLANAGEALGFPYGSAGFLEFEGRVLAAIRNGCYSVSAKLAAEKGSFPLFDKERYLQGEFIKTLPEDVREEITRHGIRNSHLTSIAPTGTISQCADNVSSGIEPVFDYVTKRVVNMNNGPVVVDVPDYGFAKLGVKGRRCRDVTAKQHVDVLIRAQQHVDSSVSKTCNVAPDTPWDQFKQIYMDAYNGGAKGCTTYQIGCKRGAVLTETSCAIDPTTGEKYCS